MRRLSLHLLTMLILLTGNSVNISVEILERGSRRAPNEWEICLGTLTHDSQCQDATVLHALAVSTFEGDAAAHLQVIVLWGLLVRHGWTPSVVGRVLLQDVTGSYHHPRGLGGDVQELSHWNSDCHPKTDLWCTASDHFIRYKWRGQAFRNSKSCWKCSSLILDFNDTIASCSGWMGVLDWIEMRWLWIH